MNIGLPVLIPPFDLPTHLLTIGSKL